MIKCCKYVEKNIKQIFYRKRIASFFLERAIVVDDTYDSHTDFTGNPYHSRPKLACSPIYLYSILTNYVFPQARME